jgi:ATP-dependent protease ClpP protease subunit
MNVFDYSSKNNRNINMATDTDNYIINVIKDTSSIYFNGEINNFSMEKLTNELLKMELSIKQTIKKVSKIVDDAKEKIKEITDENENDITLNLTNNMHIKLYITTYGGCVHNAFSIIDIIKCMEIPIHTICKGCVASAGTLISLSGKKRFITKHSYMLMHELRTSCWGKFSYIKDEFINAEDLMECIKTYYVNNSKITMEEIEQQLKQDKMWDATTCLTHGLVDEILS